MLVRENRENCKICLTFQNKDWATTFPLKLAHKILALIGSQRLLQKSARIAARLVARQVTIKGEITFTEG